MSILYSSQIIGENPVVYYRFGEASGLVATDSSGNGNTGTISATGVTYSVAGVILNDTNKAFTLNGTSGNVACPTSVSPAPWAQLTAACWVKLSTLTLTGAPSVIANEPTATSKKGFSFNFNATGTALTFTLGNGSTSTTATGNFTFVISTWYYIAATWDGTTMTVYVNGVSKGTATFSGSIAASTHAITFGHTPTAPDFFTGTIDEGAVYDYAWFVDTLLSNYNLALNGDGGGNLYNVNAYTTILAQDFNQILQILQAVPGGKEIGKYNISGNCYTASGQVCSYIQTLSHDVTPVSVTLDTADGAPPAWMSAPGTSLLTSGGVHVFVTYSAANAGGVAAGNFTFQF